MRVPLLDLKPQYQTLRKDIERAITEVCETQQFVLGPNVRALENEIAGYSGTRFGIGVSSGTDALLVALMALGVGRGDEVVTTAFSFFATAGVIARLGATPVFCDIDAADFNLSPLAVRSFLEAECERREAGLFNRATGGRIKALLPVDLYGQMAAMDTFVALGREFGLAVVEDAAQSIGATLPSGARAGALGDIGAFSFFPTKNLGAFGDAGMCVTNDEQLAERLALLRVHGGARRYYHAVVGGNFRLDELQAAVLRVKLEHLEAWTAGRERNAAHYFRAFAARGLDERLTLPVVREGARHVFNQFVIRAPQRDELKDFLAEHGVGSEVYYPLPLPEQQCFAGVAYRADEGPEAARAAREVLALPIYAELGASELDYVVERIAAFYS